MIEQHSDELITIVNSFGDPLRQLVYLDFLYSDERINKALESFLETIYTLGNTIDDLEPEGLEGFENNKVSYDLPS